MIHTCEHCQSEYLIDLENGTYDVLVIAPDLDEEYEEDEVTAEPEPGLGDEEYDPKFQTHPDYRTNTSTVDSYKNGTPMVPGKVSEDGQKITNQPVTHYGSGIRVETNMSDKPPSDTRQRRQNFKMQPPGKATPFAPKKKNKSELTDADHSRDGFEVAGSDATQDFTGLTGAEAHFDNLMQQAYESDLRSHGF